MVAPSPLTVTPTITVIADGTMPLWVDAVGLTWGRDFDVLLSSTNEWATKTVFHDFNNGLGIAAVRDLMNGELLVSFSTELWRSSGGRSAWAKVLDSSSDDASIIHRTLSAFGHIVVVGEYGSKTNPNNARRVWLSTDSAATFTEIYDHGTVTGSHVHGVYFDPRTSRIWVCTGDVGYRKIQWAPLANPTTWTVVTADHQPTVPCAINRHVLFGSDNPPNGLLGYARKTDAFGLVTLHRIDTSATSLNYVAQTAYQRDKAGQPLLVAYRSAQIGLPGVLLATVDGFNVYELWRDSESYDNNTSGLQSMLGPTANGKLIGTLTRDSGVTDLLWVADAPTWA